MSTFQAYQSAFTAHIRRPANSCWNGVDQHRMAIYREIVFNQFQSAVTACFPLLLDILGKRRFKKVAKQCFYQHHFDSPLFRDIPLAFMEYLQSLDLVSSDLPPFAAQLAHYEWAELYLSSLNVTTPRFFQALAVRSTLSTTPLLLNPAHLLLHYDYPVHKISKKYAPLNPYQTYLCLVRQQNFHITFIEINPLTQQLLKLLGEYPQTGNAVLIRLASQTPHLPPESIMKFGMDILYTLYEQQIVLMFT